MKEEFWMSMMRTGLRNTVTDAQNGKRKEAEHQVRLAAQCLEYHLQGDSDGKDQSTIHN